MKEIEITEEQLIEAISDILGEGQYKDMEEVINNSPETRELIDLAHYSSIKFADYLD